MCIPPTHYFAQKCIHTKVYFVYHEVFDVSKEVSKVDVKEVSWGGHHDVVIVAITNALGLVM